MQLLYIANIRLPTEKAHGLQIMQNCEAFADTGVNVTLWAARRWNTADMKAIDDVWAHYGVKQNFALKHIPCIDLMPFVPNRNDLLARLVFYLQQGTFVVIAFLLALFTPADVYYSRDPIVLLVLSLVKPQRKLAYEAHRLGAGRGGRWLQSQVVRRVGTVITITHRLRHDLIQRGADSTRTLVAHDGIQQERFANMPTQAAARATLGWPSDAFIVGYVGRLQTLAMDKGVGTLVEAMRTIEGVSLALVGGPDDIAKTLRAHWMSLGLDEAHFFSAGQVAPGRVALYLSAFDVCAMPHPWTEHFAYHTSPIKLFEYMASRRAIVASDLPGWADVIHDGVSALLVPPGDVDRLADAISLLRDDPILRQRLADCAYERVIRDYTWNARAKTILNAIRGGDAD
jgi:glycosyltransferase involved in cell wall biosynthesis